MLIQTKAIKKFGKAIFADGLDEVQTLLKPLTAAENNLKGVQRHLDSKGIAETYRGVIETQQQIKQEAQSIRQDVKTGENRIITYIDKKLESWKAAQEQERLRSYDPHIIQNIVTPLYIIFNETGRAKQLQSGSYIPEIDVEFTSLTGIVASYIDEAFMPVASMAHRSQFMDILCTEDERNLPIRDLSLVTRMYQNFSDKALAQANHLIATSQFGSWLMDIDFSILLVDGHCGDQSIGSIAPTSVLCAGLVEILSGRLPSPWPPMQESSIVLYFFAGQHKVPGNGLYGPCGLLRSLIDQLLLKWPGQNLVDLAFLQDHHISGTDHGYRTQDLCYIFWTLVGQLDPDSSIYCLIDSISSFETELQGWIHDLEDIIDCFLGCVERVQKRRDLAPVKFLLISADKSTRIRHMISKTFHVGLRADNFHSQTRIHEALAADFAKTRIE